MKNELIRELKNRYLVSLDGANEEMIRVALAEVIKRRYVIDKWIESRKDTSRRICYL